MIVLLLALLVATDNIIPIKAAVSVPELPVSTCEPILHVSQTAFDFGDAKQGDGGFRLDLWTDCGQLWWSIGDRSTWLEFSRYTGVLSAGGMTTVWVRATYERLRSGNYIGGWDIHWRPCPVGDITLDCQVDENDLYLLTGWEGMILSTFSTLQNNWRRAGWVREP